jgi:hypothetical protein
VKLTKHFNAFLVHRVNLSDRRIEQLDKRVAAVSSYLETGDNVFANHFLEVIPQGSYAHRTIINPVQENDEFDADVLLSMNEVDGWEPRDYVQELYTLLRASGVYRNMVSRHDRCVKVDYANEFHIDVVPYLERHTEHYITNRVKNDYELTNPEGFNEWLDAQDRITGGRLIKVLRLLKYLRDYKNTFSVRSVILNILVGGRVNDVLLMSDSDYYNDVPTALMNILSDLDSYLQDNALMPNITDPSCTTENFNHRWDQDQYARFRDMIHYYAQKVAGAFDEEDPNLSKATWREVFGSDFATYDVDIKMPIRAHVGRAGVANTDESLESRWGIPTLVDPRYKVRIGARLQPKPKFRAYELSKHGNVVSKGRTILFRVASNNVPAPYDIYWKVRNTGEDAIQANMIRGQIERDDGSGSRSEPTAYRGHHFVECYVVKNGVCVARDRHSVVVK